MEKFYRISMGCEYESYCIRKLTDEEYKLIADIFDECDSCSKIEEVEPKWVLKVEYAVNIPGIKQGNRVCLMGRMFVPVNPNSTYRQHVFLDLPTRNGLPVRQKFFFYDAFNDDYLKYANEFCEKLDCNLINYSRDELKPFL